MNFLLSVGFFWYIVKYMKMSSYRCGFKRVDFINHFVFCESFVYFESFGKNLADFVFQTNKEMFFYKHLIFTDNKLSHRTSAAL